MAQPGPNSGRTELAHRVGPILPPLHVVACFADDFFGVVSCIVDS